MKQIQIGVHKSYHKDLIEAIHEAGIIEIINIHEKEKEISALLDEIGRSTETGQYTRNIQKINTVLESFDDQSDEKKSILHTLFSPPRRIQRVPVIRRNAKTILEETENALGEAEEALRVRNELSLVRNRFTEIHKQQLLLSLLLPFDFDISYLGDSDFLNLRAVQIAPEDFDSFIEEILKRFGEDALLLHNATEKEIIAIVATCRRELRLHDELFNDQRYRPLLPGPGSGRPSDIIASLDMDLAGLEREEKELQSALLSISIKWRDTLAALKEELELERDRSLLLTSLGRTDDAIFISGWIAEADAGTAMSICENITDGHVFSRMKSPSDEDTTTVPIKYNNPSWLQPFEFLTNMFSPPGYDEIDPTLFIGPILILFFGLMLGDAVYGLILFFLSLLLFRGAGRASRTINNISIILMAAGVSTILFGIVQGGYMGDLLPRFLGIDPPFILISPLDDPIAFLRIALIAGIIQINLGIIIGIYQNIRRRKYREILFGQVSWFIIQPSAAILLFSFFGWADIEMTIIAAAAAGAATGVGMLFINEGPLGFFSITGFLGDWLSYARLLALALATSGIAMTVNILTGMLGGGFWLLAVPAAAIFFIGHMFNFTLQSLGAFVHSLRLQYVEFFGYFYQGGGKMFSPFCQERNMTEIVEEVN